MSYKLSVQHLYKVFGHVVDKGLALARQGTPNEDILRQTGCAVALRDVSLHINDHELLVIMGLSGSGKSTLLRCLNRLIEPTSGSVELDGQDITHLPEKQMLAVRQKSFGMVFQNFALFPHRDVLANVGYGLELMGMPPEERQQKALEALDVVGLRDWAARYPDQLSGGMQQRVGLARALALDSDILLMDEAFSALDPLIRREMQDELLSLQRDLRKTIVFITHDLDEALKLGDRIVVLRDGQIVQIGTPEALLMQPADEYVRRFVSSADLSAVLTAEMVMKPTEATAVLGHDGPRSALHKMRIHSLTSLFVLDAQLRLQGIITADDAERLSAQGVRELDTIVNTDITCVPPETPATELMALMSASASPIAVTSESGRLLGVIVRGRLLGALVECKECVHDAA